MAGIAADNKREATIARARLFQSYGYPVPTDILMELHTQGVDLDALERNTDHGQA